MLLLGARAAVTRQASEGGRRVVWTLHRAHLINGGDGYVDDAVGLLRALGYVPLGAAAEALDDALTTP